MLVIGGDAGLLRGRRLGRAGGGGGGWGDGGGVGVGVRGVGGVDGGG